MELEIIQQLDWIDPKVKWLAIEAELRHETGHGIPTHKVKKDGRWVKERLYQNAKELFAFFIDAQDRGLSPSFALNYLLMVGDKLTIWGEGANAKVLGTGELIFFDDGFTGTFPNNDFAAFCVMERRGIKGRITRTFSIGDAKRAGLWDDRVSSTDNPDFYKYAKPQKGNYNFASFWYKYPYRMLEARAWSFAARKLFSDALGGLYTREEMIGSEELTEVSDDTLSVAKDKPRLDYKEPSKVESVARKTKPYEPYKAPLSYNKAVSKKEGLKAQESKIDQLEDEDAQSESQLKKLFMKGILSTDAYSVANTACLTKNSYPLISDRETLSALYETFTKQLDGKKIEDFDFDTFTKENMK